MRVSAIFLLVWLLLSSANFAAPQQSTPANFVLEDGTPVNLVLSQTISSADEHVGNLVALAVAEDVKIGEVIVIPKGALAWGTIRKVRTKRRMGRAGKLEVEINRVRLADGEKATLSDIQDSSGKNGLKWMIPAMAVTGVLAWPAAPIFLLMHGKDAAIPKGTPVTAFVKGDNVLDPGKFMRVTSATTGRAASTAMSASATPAAAPAVTVPSAAASSAVPTSPAVVRTASTVSVAAATAAPGATANPTTATAPTGSSVGPAPAGPITPAPVPQPNAPQAATSAPSPAAQASASASAAPATTAPAPETSSSNEPSKPSHP